MPSAGVQFPSTAVQAAKELSGGFAKHTVGSVIAQSAKSVEEEGEEARAKRAKTCDPQDPHSHLTGSPPSLLTPLLPRVRCSLCAGCS